MVFVRLACVRHAASVRPEPGSNSPFDSWRVAFADFFLDRLAPARNSLFQRLPRFRAFAISLPVPPQGPHTFSNSFRVSASEPDLDVCCFCFLVILFVMVPAAPPGLKKAARRGRNGSKYIMPGPFRQPPRRLFSQGHTDSCLRLYFFFSLSFRIFCLNFFWNRNRQC